MKRRLGRVVALLILGCAVVNSAGIAGFAGMKNRVWAATAPDVDAVLMKKFTWRGKSVEVMQYWLKRDIMAVVSGTPRIKLWYDMSPRFRAELDVEIERAAGEEAEKADDTPARDYSLPRSLFERRGTLAVTGPGEDGCVYFNGVYAGRLPRLILEVPADRYMVDIRTAEGMCCKEVVVSARRSSELVFAAEELGPEASESDKWIVSGLSWWRPLHQERPVALFPQERGVIVAATGEGFSISLYDQETGGLIWREEHILTPRRRPVFREGTIAWGGPTGTLYLFEVGERSTREVTLGGELLTEPRWEGDALVCAAADGGEGGWLALVQDGTVKWKRALEGVFERLDTASTAVLTVTKEADLGISALTAYDIDSGDELWSKWVGNAGRFMLATGEKQLVFWNGMEDAPGHVLDIATGNELLTIEAEGGAGLGGALVKGNKAVFVTDDDQAHMFDLDEMRLAWRASLSPGTGGRTRVLAIDERCVLLYAEPGTNGVGTVTIVSRESGRLLYSGELCLSDVPLRLGEKAVLLLDGRGRAMVRELERGVIPWSFDPEVSGGKGNHVAVAVGRECMFLASEAMDRLYSFALKELLRVRSLEHTP